MIIKGIYHLETDAGNFKRKAQIDTETSQLTILNLEEDIINGDYVDSETFSFKFLSEKYVVKVIDNEYNNLTVDISDIKSMFLKYQLEKKIKSSNKTTIKIKI